MVEKVKDKKIQNILKSNVFDYFNHNFNNSDSLTILLDYNDIFLLNNWEGLQLLIKRNPDLKFNFKMQ
jgi:hypothetical protein